ncbi:MAG: nicotinate (nicotinamide) nucleotide adenylyltransferase [Bacteroidales bacterium]|nr:nicotinate (nicotinamide) nucleotide adenylyltransferase [Bacteroidales bacterium]
MSSSKTGLFFGSFNPIHSGHLMIASYMAEFTDLKQVWFVVSPHNPLKEKSTLLADHHRLAMVNLAIEEDQRFKVSNIEFKLPQPSYTIDTMTYLSEKYPLKKFALIAGSDIFPTFHKWKNYEELLKQYHFYIYPRPGTGKSKFDGHPAFTGVDAPMITISSSFIRNGIKDGKDMIYFLPDKVWKYIAEMHFYK